MEVAVQGAAMEAADSGEGSRGNLDSALRNTEDDTHAGCLEALEVRPARRAGPLDSSARGIPLKPTSRDHQEHTCSQTQRGSARHGKPRGKPGGSLKGALGSLGRR